MSVTTRLLDNFDFILLLVDFIEIKPWEKILNDGMPSLFSITKDSYPFQVHLCDISKENGKKSLLKIVI
jgi:hypothetical protein